MKTDMRQKTEDLALVRETPSLFIWGRIKKIHDVGSYTLVEYVNDHNETTLFHIYVNGKNTSNGAHTLEAAMLFAMAWNHLEANEARYMARAACKLFELKDSGT